MESTSFNFLRDHHQINADHEEKLPLQNDSDQKEIDLQAPYLDSTSSTVPYEACCECDNCIIKFSTFWLGCGCAQFGYSVMFWYIVNVIWDSYSFISDPESQLSL